MRTWLFILLILPLSAFAQKDVTVSMSNLFRYGTSSEVINPFTRTRDYLENLTDTKIAVSDFVIGFRLLYDSPPENGVESTGLKKRFIEYKKEDLSIRAGDSYALYGRGLALNLFEKRTLAFDNGLDGIKMEYKTQLMKLSVLGGNIRYLDILDLNRVEEYKIRGGSLEITPCALLSVGADFVSGKYRFPSTSAGEYTGQFNIPEVSIRVHAADVDLYMSYAEKRTTSFLTPANPIPGPHTGTGFYASAGYAGEAFGISAEYKDYRFGIANPDVRIDPDRSMKILAFQNPPIVHKEHSFTLLSRYPHVIDFNDEVGYQVDLFYTVAGQFTGSVNVAMASRHYSNTPTGDSSRVTRLPNYRGENRKNSILPSLESRFSPFWEVYSDLTYYFVGDGNDYLQVGFNRRSDDTAEEMNIAPGSLPRIESRRTTAVPIAVQYSLPSEWVLRLTVENQWVYDDGNVTQSGFRNHLFSAAASQSPSYSVAIRFEWTNDYRTVDGKRNWTAVDVGFRVKTNHLATLTIGSERGGQVCSNGICRIVPPFSGLRVGITSYL